MRTNIDPLLQTAAEGDQRLRRVLQVWLPNGFFAPSGSRQAAIEWPQEGCRVTLIDESGGETFGFDALDEALQYARSA
ncbi:MAG: hypothetical protein AAFY08_15660 [Planctomycetota bacterium]